MLVFFPSSRLRDRMLVEGGGAWTERTADGDLHLVVKAPTHSIRAVHRFGAAASLRVALVELDGARLLVFGVRIEDEPGCPNTFVAPLREARDVDEVVQLLARSEVRVHVFNELTLNLLAVDCDLPSEAKSLRDRLVAWVPQVTEVRSARRATIDAIMDHVEALESGHESLRQAVVHVWETLPLRCDRTTELEVVYLGAGTFKLSDLDEGGELERLVFPLFEWLCPTRAFLSPKIDEQGKRRELTDVLAFTPAPECTEEGFFLIESKALSVVNAKQGKSSDKRGRSVEKDIRKGIRQLLGAAKNVHSGSPIYDRDGVPIDMQERAKAVGHGLVLLSEMHSSVDWGEVARQIEEARSKLLVHVMDLAELQKLVSQSEGRPAVFESFLIQRWEAVFEHRGLVRTRVVRPAADA